MIATYITTQSELGFLPSDVRGCRRCVLGAFLSSLPAFQDIFSPNLKGAQENCYHATRQHQSDPTLPIALLVAVDPWD